MGFGVSLIFIAVGAILAFAIRFNISGLDLQMIGWILMGVGAVAMAVTFAYTRPRRGQVSAVVEDEPVYINHPDPTEPQPHVHDETGTPHPVRERRFSRFSRFSRRSPGRYIDDRPAL
jgi:hypothetical protein